MKLIITAPKGESIDTWATEMLRYGLLNEGISIGENRKDFTLEWNPVYKYYNLILKPILMNGARAQTTHWHEVYCWLDFNCYEFKMTDSWDFLNDHVQIKTKHFEIFPKKV